MPLNTKLISLSQITPRHRCPECNATLLREPTQQDEISANGASLWTLILRCNICPWSSSLSNVKMGV